MRRLEKSISKFREPFGEIIHFYGFLSKEIRKEWKKKFFKIEVFKESEIEWLKTLQFLRNDCAHDNRIFGRTFNTAPLIHINDMEKIFGKENLELIFSKRNKLKDEKKKEEYDKLKVKIEKSKKKTLFSALIIMRYFVESSSLNTKRNWNSFLDRLEQEIDDKEIELYRVGFVESWKNILYIP